MAEKISEARIAEMKARLLARRDDLRAQGAAGESWRGTVELDQQSVGRLSRMDAMQQQAMSEAEARQRQSDLRRIDAALERIAEGEYGYCLACGEPVAPKRLEIDPAATHCIGCAR